MRLESLAKVHGTPDSVPDGQNEQEDCDDSKSRETASGRKILCDSRAERC